MLERMDSFFDKRISEYDEHMRNDIVGATDFYHFTAEQLPSEAGCHIVDLGCGTGLELEEYYAMNPNACVTGIDLSSAMLNKLAEKFLGKELKLIQSSYFDTPLGSETYDAAVSVESLHHYPAEQKISLYSKLRTSLRKNGYFILTDYFAESEAQEKEYFDKLKTIKREQNITDSAYYHFDTPLTVKHEIEALLKAGFSKVIILRNWEATFTLKAER